MICDEDGLYDPRNFNDRLLLGMKGQLSEAELHFIRARLRGGIISKARRGELITPLPAGLAYDGAAHVILDPGTAVQGALRRLFATFEATGSASACVKPHRPRIFSLRETPPSQPRSFRTGPWFLPRTHSPLLRAAVTVSQAPPPVRDNAPQPREPSGNSIEVTVPSPAGLLRASRPPGSGAQDLPAPAH